MRYQAHRLTQVALASGDPSELVTASDAHWRAARAHREAGMHEEAAGHEGQARLLAYASRNPQALGARTPARIESQKKATAAAAAKFNLQEHPRGSAGRWAPTGKGTHSHEHGYRGY